MASASSMVLAVSAAGAECNSAAVARVYDFCETGSAGRAAFQRTKTVNEKRVCGAKVHMRMPQAQAYAARHAAAAAAGLLVSFRR